ncbi:hypothetical protein EJ06DRAFT_549870 [Trichodelitschia bisporula]|uniref:Xylanolytic transcriptional activator regulatory domain-containing protein n=1 Tax=Trichodelitschia bisporula TaxID=703511 RepID=A0A6G1HTC7_9PEZI|nr:hypothetical protein EJ06DRAFT_549870 [Trichodelitschia bisporula]
MASRPQIGIDRLPARHLSNEPREIKCNRLLPACDSCKLFACDCIYDAVPKKRGPKTDALEALVKRVDFLEKQLHEEKSSSPADVAAFLTDEGEGTPVMAGLEETKPLLGALNAMNAMPQHHQQQQQQHHQPGPNHHQIQGQQHHQQSQHVQPQQSHHQAQHHQQHDRPTNGIQALESIEATSPYDTHLLPPLTTADAMSTPQAPYLEALLDAYFACLHGRPYFILDEASTRQRLQTSQLPGHLAFAIFAVSARYAPQYYAAYDTAVQAGIEYGRRARLELDVDEPSIEGLQTLLLLAQASFQTGRGKQAYMYLSFATTMSHALSLHRELPPDPRIPPPEREGRRRLFWAVYLLDRFSATGSKRPHLVPDDAIALRLPAVSSPDHPPQGEGDFFANGAGLHPVPGGAASEHLRDAAGMLIGIVRILGFATRYLAAGGVKGDARFPWHAQSTLSKIRRDLDLWDAATAEALSALPAHTPGSKTHATLLLAKATFHTVHALIYRPFLPLDLALLRSTSHHQWQIAATAECIRHANLLADLAPHLCPAAGPPAPIPAFASFALATAGTIHVHAAHYRLDASTADLFSPTTAAEALAREMRALATASRAWACAAHHAALLKAVYAAHVSVLTSASPTSSTAGSGTGPGGPHGPTSYPPPEYPYGSASPAYRGSAGSALAQDDFFDRYPGRGLDGAYLPFMSGPVAGGEGWEAGSPHPGSPAVLHTPVLAHPTPQGGQGGYFLPPHLGAANPRKRRRTEGSPHTPLLGPGRVQMSPGSQSGGFEVRDEGGQGYGGPYSAGGSSGPGRFPTYYVVLEPEHR